MLNEIKEQSKHLMSIEKNIFGYEIAIDSSINCKKDIRDNKDLKKLLDYISPIFDNNHNYTFAFFSITSKRLDKSLDCLELGIFYSQFSKIALKLNYADRAIGIAFQALDFFKNINHLHKVYALAHIATSYRNLSNFSKAIEYYTKAKKASNILGLYALENWQVFRLGKMYVNYLNQPSRGVEYIKKAQDMFSKIDNKSGKLGVAACIDELGDIFRQVTIDYDIAYSYYISAMELNKLINNQRGIARNIAHIGLLHEAEGDLLNSIKMLTESVEILRRIPGERRGLGLRLGQLSRLYVKQNMPIEAYSCLDEAQIISKYYNDKVAMIKHMICQGQYFESIEKFFNAEKSYNMAISMCDENSQYSLKGKILLKLFNLYIDDIGDYDKIKTICIDRIDNNKKEINMIKMTNPAIEDVEQKTDIAIMYKSLYEKVLKDAQDELSSMAVTLSRIYDIAISAHEEKINNLNRIFQIGAVMASSSHNIRNTLNNIVNMLNTLISKKMNDTDTVTSLLSIKENLLLSEKAISDKLVYSMLCINEKNNRSLAIILIENIANNLRKNCELNNVDFITDFKLNDELVNITQAELETILGNIVQNSIDSMKSIDNKFIKIFAEINGQYLTIKVIDNGIGIGEQDIAKIFQMEFTTKPGSTGIGLTVVRHLIELCGGKIYIDNNANTNGATVSISLPLPGKKD